MLDAAGKRNYLRAAILPAAALLCVIIYFIVDAARNKADISYDDETMTLKSGDNSYRLVTVEGGQFKMGSQLGAFHSLANEAPQHGVSLSTFAIGSTEVPQWLWIAVMGDDDDMIAPYFNGNNHPVENVSWIDCMKFIEKLNKITGQKFRLPTEAEWEYAARGGKKAMTETLYAGSDSADIVGWHAGNSSRVTSACAAKKANPLGLYDLTGNVAEWTQDYYGIYPQGFVTDPHGPSTSASAQRVIRGGSFNDSLNNIRIKSRFNAKEDARANNIGLRLATDI